MSKVVVNLCLHVCAEIDLGLVKSPVLGYIILNNIGPTGVSIGLYYWLCFLAIC